MGLEMGMGMRMGCCELVLELRERIGKQNRGDTEGRTH